MENLNYEIPNFGELKKLEDDLYWTQFQLPFKLNHVNLFFLDTEEGLLIIDAGLRSEHSHVPRSCHDHVFARCAAVRRTQ